MVAAAAVSPPVPALLLNGPVDPTTIIFAVFVVDTAVPGRKLPVRPRSCRVG
jgi:hypothetical protein